MTITYEVNAGLYVNTTNRCSNACAFCVRSKDSYGDLWLEREPTRDEILSDIKRRDLAKYEEIVFCGYGEPSYRLPELVWTAKELKKAAKLLIRMNTNGQSDLIWGRDTTDDFVEAFDAVSISLNAARAADYQAICLSEYGEAAFDAIIDFTSRLSRKIPSVILSVVRGTISDGDIDLCREIARNAGAALRIRELI